MNTWRPRMDANASKEINALSCPTGEEKAIEKKGDFSELSNPSDAARPKRAAPGRIKTTPPAAVEAPEPHHGKRIRAAAVCDLCGGVTPETLYQWSKSASLGFPVPIVIGNVRYWRESEIIAWLDRQPRAAGPEA